MSERRKDGSGRPRREFSRKDLERARRFLDAIGQQPGNPFDEKLFDDKTAFDSLSSAKQVVGSILERSGPAGKSHQRRGIRESESSDEILTATNARLVADLLQRVQGDTRIAPNLRSEVAPATDIISGYGTQLAASEQIRREEQQKQARLETEREKVFKRRRRRVAGVLGMGLVTVALGRGIPLALELHKQQQLEYERTHILPMTPTDPSFTDWQVQYIPPEKGVTYEPTNPTNVEVDNDTYIDFSHDLRTFVTGDYITGIKITRYTRVDGVNTIQFKVVQSVDLAGNSSSDQEYLLPLSPGTQFRDSVILLTNTNLKEKRYVHIRQEKDNDNFRVDTLQRNQETRG